jgi:signal transduction histidine kinase
MPNRLTRSLSFRLLAIFLLMGALFAYGSLLAVRWVYETDELRELVRGHLSLHVEYVLQDIGNPPQVDRALAITGKVPVDIRIEGPGLDWASDPRFPAVDALRFGDSSVFEDQTSQWLSGLPGVRFATYRGHNFIRLDQGPYAIVVSSPKIGDPVVERHLIPVIVGFALVLVLLTYLAVRWLFRPIEAIRHGAAQIGRGNFDQRITEVRSDQLGDLATDINTMAADVQRMLDAKRQLLLGISHELRSPLSRMRLALELSDNSAVAPGMRDDVNEMDRIITTLLEAERLNNRHAPLQVEETPVNALVDQLLDEYFAAQLGRIEVRGPPELVVNVDKARATLMLKNLLANALRHARPGAGAVVIEFGLRDEGWWISITDNGPGIPASQVEMLGEPFYRGDPSRTRGTGGSGLGLYLARLVAEAHGGTLRLDREHRGGARFVVELPLSPTPARV